MQGRDVLMLPGRSRRAAARQPVAPAHARTGCKEGRSAGGGADQVQLPQGGGVVVRGGRQQGVDDHPPRRHAPVGQVAGQLLRPPPHSCRRSDAPACSLS